MNILMLLEHDFPGDVRVDKEVQSLHIAGHNVIVASSTSSLKPPIEKLDNCFVYRKKISPFIKKSSVGALKFPFYFNFWRSFINEIIKIEKIDAIHVHDLPLAKVGIEFKKGHGVKIVIDLHENWPSLLEISQHTNTVLGKLLSSKKQWRKYEVEMTDKADALIAVVQEMKDRLINLKISSEKIFVLENTPSVIPKTIEKRTDNEYFTLTYIGGVTEARGLQYVLEGMAILTTKSKNIRLWIAGDGRYLPELKRLSCNLGIDHCVKFFGKVASSETTNILTKTDVALIPHVRSEQSDNSSPNKLFEYMCAGIPVIASNCNSLKRVIETTKSGDTYEFDSPLSFAEKVLEFQKNQDNLELYSKNGRLAVEQTYNWDQSAKSIINLYSNLNHS